MPKFVPVANEPVPPVAAMLIEVVPVVILVDPKVPPLRTKPKLPAVPAPPEISDPVIVVALRLPEVPRSIP
jgi:hypothetical protein